MKIEYSIISRGTEKYNNQGYMSISELIDNKRYLLVVNHNVKEAEIDEKTMIVDGNYSIENISLSRFCLISRLFLERENVKDNILILGLGNLGFSLLIELLKKGYKNINIYTRNYYNDLKEIEKLYGIKINRVDKVTDSFNTYFDTTGSSLVLNELFNNIGVMKTVVILSTPRDDDYLISPLLINRKNISLYGAHELFGYDQEYRNSLFNKILKENKHISNINKYVSIHEYSKVNYEKLLNKKTNFIDVFKY